MQKTKKTARINPIAEAVSKTPVERIDFVALCADFAARSVQEELNRVDRPDHLDMGEIMDNLEVIRIYMRDIKAYVKDHLEGDLKT